MSCLYLLNKPLTSKAIEDINNLLCDDDAILLFEDAVYAACEFMESPFPVKTGVLIPDCQTRGIIFREQSSARVERPFARVENYDEMVNWVTSHDKSLTWSV